MTSYIYYNKNSKLKSIIPCYKRIQFLAVFIFALLPAVLWSQEKKKDKKQLSRLSLSDCIQLAVQNQPALKQSAIDERIAHDNNLIGLSSWMPQVGGSAIFTNYFELPTAFSGTNKVLSGTNYTTIPGISITQNLFSSDALLAARSAKLNTNFYKENSALVKINLVANVTKAFYDLLLTLQQITVFQDDTARLGKAKSDTYHQYISGLVDKVDNKQATIAYNNTVALLKSAQLSVQYKQANLKQLIGISVSDDLNLMFDTSKMLQEVQIDTAEVFDLTKRVEYRQLLISKRLQKENVRYNQFSFLPSLGGFYNYYHEFESNNFSGLYSTAYPYSFWGLNLNFPLFQGFKRIENLHKAKLQQERLDWDEVNLSLGLMADYQKALAIYKSNLINLTIEAENFKLANEVYTIVQLQYKEGIKPYLNVIAAESDLRTAEINYLDALFQVLATKVDLQKAMGTLNTNF
jgi:outer membrane protein TolC